jgi:hypothetical protein
MKNIFKLLILSIILSGCSSVPDKYIGVSVDSINAPNSNEYKKYILVSKNKEVSENSLQFQEYSRYVKKVLSLRGFVESETADIKIELGYGTKDPLNRINMSAKSISNEYGSGSSVNVGSYSEYVNFVTLNATDFKENQMWKISAYSSSTTEDLRYVFPYLMKASKPYISENTGSKLYFKFKISDRVPSMEDIEEEKPFYLINYISDKINED